jgi:hypothetical protein
MATASSATAPWRAVQAVLNNRGHYGLPRESMTLVGPPRRPGDYPLTEEEIDAKIAAGEPRVGADPKIMTPAEEAEFVRNYQYLAGKPSDQEIEARMAEEDTRARLAEEAVLRDRDEQLAEQTRVREKEFQDNRLHDQRAEETFVNQQLASQAHFEAKVQERVTEEERARREATLLSQEEVDRANVEAQQREEKTKAEIAARDREEKGNPDLDQIRRFGFAASEVRPSSTQFDAWGGAKGIEEAGAEDIRAWETAKAEGFPPGPATGEIARPQTRNNIFLPGEIVDTFA